MSTQINVERHDRVSVEEQLQRMSVSDLFLRLQEANSALAGIGVKTPISMILRGGYGYGTSYEDTRHPGSNMAKATPLNSFAALAHAEPAVLRLPQSKLEELFGIIAIVSQAAETIYSKRGTFDYPDSLTKSPRKI